MPKKKGMLTNGREWGEYYSEKAIVLERLQLSG